MPSSHGAYRTDEGLNGVHGLDASIETLAERLRAAGYRTAAFVGNDAYLDPALGMNRGFERYQTENTRPASRLVWAAQHWLRRHGRRPSFLFLNVMDAHQPYRPPPPYDRLFPGKLDDVEPYPTERIAATGRRPDEATMQHYVSQYDGELRYVDDRLDELFATYRQLGRWDDALVVVTSDHGELFDEHGALGHGGPPYHGLVRVPLLIKYPRAARRGVVREPVSLADVASTVLATVGLPLLPGNGPPLWERHGPVMAETMLPGDGVIRAVYDGSGRRADGPPGRGAPGDGDLRPHERSGADAPAGGGRRCGGGSGGGRARPDRADAAPSARAAGPPRSRRRAGAAAESARIRRVISAEFRALACEGSR